MPSSEVMQKWKSGDLHSGSKSGKQVSSQKQAIAIMLSEKRNEDKHGGHYVSKSEGAKDANYAQGGPVLGRKSGDWAKTVPNKGFLNTPDRFRNDGGANRDPTPEPTEDVWGKGSSKANPKAVDKSEKAILPRK